MGNFYWLGEPSIHTSLLAMIWGDLLFICMRQQIKYLIHRQTRTCTGFPSLYQLWLPCPMMSLQCRRNSNSLASQNPSSIFVAAEKTRSEWVFFCEWLLLHNGQCSRHLLLQFVTPLNETKFNYKM
jgi:hypothetical protein